jgi:hypothetical protein
MTGGTIVGTSNAAGVGALTDARETIDGGSTDAIARQACSKSRLGSEGERFDGC